jgi:hypothetical protein
LTTPIPIQVSFDIRGITFDHVHHNAKHLVVPRVRIGRNWGTILSRCCGGFSRPGETVFAEDRPFYIERHGFPGSVCFDISYSLVPDAACKVGGVLCIVSEMLKDRTMYVFAIALY